MENEVSVAQSVYYSYIAQFMNFCKKLSTTVVTTVKQTVTPQWCLDRNPPPDKPP